MARFANVSVVTSVIDFVGSDQRAVHVFFAGSKRNDLLIASVVMDVDRSNFYPVPNVDSAVVKMDIVENKFPLISRKAFRDIVRCAFSSRRKTLVNNMMNVFKLSRADAEDLLNKTGIPVNVRGEALSTELFVKLSNLLVESKIVD